jgi:hypothetical protein
MTAHTRSLWKRLELGEWISLIARAAGVALLIFTIFGGLGGLGGLPAYGLISALVLVGLWYE